MHFFTGLSELSNGELFDLKQEMAAYVKEYSDVLIEELTLREELEREKEIKNKFISTLLTVQSKIRELQAGQTKGKKGSSTNSGKVNIICLRGFTLLYFVVFIKLWPFSCHVFTFRHVHCKKPGGLNIIVTVVSEMLHTHCRFNWCICQ